MTASKSGGLRLLQKWSYKLEEGQSNAEALARSDGSCIHTRVVIEEMDCGRVELTPQWRHPLLLGGGPIVGEAMHVISC